MNSNLIDGQWVGCSEAQTSINPSDISDIIGEYSKVSLDQVEDAIAASTAAFPGWSATTIQQRFDILDGVGSEILARREELGQLIAREEGKTINDGVAEATRAGQVFKFFAGETVRISGESIASTRSGVEIEVTREALGPVALITPWNYPLAIPAQKIAPALAYGCTVVFKPASLVPACSVALVQILENNGIPPGVVNLVKGSGAQIGGALVKDHRVAGISFTGSTLTGRKLSEISSNRGARVQLEMGGKNPLLVLDDADLENAAQVAVDGAFFQAGQRCTASSRLIVADGIHDQFVDNVQRRMKSLKVDHALKEGTDIGPVVDGAPLNEIICLIDAARKDGAVLREGGEPLTRDTRGHYISPALLTETTNSMPINKIEVFGPVATIIRVRDFEEGIDVANDTEFGLSSGICTSSLKYAREFRRRSKAGLIMVNLPTAGVDYHVPFGGQKASSYGPREQGHYAQEFYTSIKTSYIRPI